MLEVQHTKQKGPHKTDLKDTRTNITGRRKEVQTERHGSSSKNIHVFFGMT